MPPELLSVATLPLRLAGRVGRIALGPLAGVAGRAIGIAGDLLGHNGAEPDREDQHPAAPRTADPDTPAPPRAARAPVADPPTAHDAPDAAPPAAYVEPPDVSVVEAAGTGPVPESAVDEPVHVSEEPVLVAESADPEAADGVRTDLHVAEPWDGYRKSTAPDVIAALETCNSAQLAMVSLYESTHRARKTVLEAADRELARR